MVMKGSARSLVRVCDQCSGDGEVDVYCDECGEQLFEDSVALTNPDICKKCDEDGHASFVSLPLPGETGRGTP